MGEAELLGRTELMRLAVFWGWPFIARDEQFLEQQDGKMNKMEQT